MTLRDAEKDKATQHSMPEAVIFQLAGSGQI